MVTGNASVVANADSDDVANMASLEVPVQVRVSDNILQAQGQLQQKPKAVKTSNDEKVHQVLQLMIPRAEQFAHGCAGARAHGHTEAWAHGRACMECQQWHSSAGEPISWLWFRVVGISEERADHFGNPGKKRRF